MAVSTQGTATVQTIEGLIARGRLREARRVLEGGVAGGADQATQLALKAQVLAGLAEFDKATEAARAALALDPQQARAYYVLGFVAEAQGNPQGAAGGYRQAIQADPSFAPAYHAFGLLLYRAGELEPAAQALRRALALDPRNWRYAAGVALLEPGVGRARALRAAYRTGIAQGNGSLGLRWRLLGTYLSQALVPLLGNRRPANQQLGAAMFMQIQQRPVYLTYVLIAINVFMYLLMETHGGSQNTATLDLFGAKDSAEIVHHGQWWRLITPMFLHAGLTHLLVNSVSLYFVGPLYERCVGRSRFLYVYFFAGVGGSLLSLARSNDLAVGASGAIFGIFGALGVYFFRNRHLFGGISRSIVRQVVILSAVNLLLPTVVAGVDGWAHLGGLLAGIGAAYLAGPALSDRTPGVTPEDALRERRSPAAVVVLLVGAAVALAVLCALIIQWNPAGA